MGFILTSPCAMDRAARPGCNALAAGLLAAPGLLAAVLPVAPARADYTGGMSVQEQRFYDYGPNGSGGSSKGNTILDSTNPIDLMNKIRKGTAMDEATTPTDAIDAALKELEVQAPAPGLSPSAPLVKAP
jgi:hypothetical protein